MIELPHKILSDGVNGIELYLEKPVKIKTYRTQYRIANIVFYTALFGFIGYFVASFFI